MFLLRLTQVNFYALEIQPVPALWGRVNIQARRRTVKKKKKNKEKGIMDLA